MMGTLYQQLSRIEQETNRLAEQREVLCQQIHEECEEAERIAATKYRTTIKHGDYGIYNGQSFTIFIEHRGKIGMVDSQSTHFEIDMDDKEKESLFEKHGNIFERMAERKPDE